VQVAVQSLSCEVGLLRTGAGQLADAAGVVLHTASLREELTATAAEHALTARRDPSPGLGNRLAFDEALVDAQERVDAGKSVTVLTLDATGSSTSRTPPGTTPATSCCAATAAPTTSACARAATSSPSSCPTPRSWPPTALTPSPPSSAG